MLLTREHYELMDQFEREFAGEGRMDKEGRELWAAGNIYQNGHVNDLFLAYRRGYSFGKVVGRDEV